MSETMPTEVVRPVTPRGEATVEWSLLLSTLASGKAIRFPSNGPVDLKRIRYRLSAHARTRGYRLHAHDSGDALVAWIEKK